MDAVVDGAQEARRSSIEKRPIVMDPPPSAFERLPDEIIEQCVPAARPERAREREKERKKERERDCFVANFTRLFRIVESS